MTTKKSPAKKMIKPTTKKTTKQPATVPTVRRDQMLINLMRESLGGISEALGASEKAAKAKKSGEQRAFLLQSVQALKRALENAGDLFKEGGKWERKFAALEEATASNNALDFDTVAWLYWTTQRFFKTGMSALVQIQETTMACEHCRQATNLSFAIMSTHVANLKDVLQQAGVTMPAMTQTLHNIVSRVPGEVE